MQHFTIGVWINRLSGHIICKPQIVIIAETEIGSGQLHARKSNNLNTTCLINWLMTRWVSGYFIGVSLTKIWTHDLTTEREMPLTKLQTNAQVAVHTGLGIFTFNHSCDLVKVCCYLFILALSRSRINSAIIRVICDISARAGDLISWPSGEVTSYAATTVSRLNPACCIFFFPFGRCAYYYRIMRASFPRRCGNHAFFGRIYI